MFHINRIDAKLKVPFGGEGQVSMFDLAKIVSQHVKAVFRATTYYIHSTFQFYSNALRACRASIPALHLPSPSPKYFIQYG